MVKQFAQHLGRALAAVQAFAGTPVERARYYPEDDDFLLEREPEVVDYDVAGLV